MNGGAASVRYWLHNGMLTMGEAKMSKSLGNIVTIRSLLEEHDGETLRYALLSGQYRQSLAWSDGLLDQAKAASTRSIRRCATATMATARRPRPMKMPAWRRFPQTC